MGARVELMCAQFGGVPSEYEAWLPAKSKLRLRSWQTMTVYTRRYLAEGIVNAYFVFLFGLLWGKP
jgi:hypothetical protein